MLPKDNDIYNKDTLRIIIHHSASKDNSNLNMLNIKKYHESKGWTTGYTGYHELIELVNGEAVCTISRPPYFHGAHTKEDNINYKSIGICIVGDFDKAKPDDILLNRLDERIESYKCLYENIIIEPHRKYATYKSCPGKHFPMERYGYVEDIKPIGYKKANLNIIKALPKDIYLLNELTTIWDAKGFDGINGTFFNPKNPNQILGIAFDREELYSNGVSWRPPRACFIIRKDLACEIVSANNFYDISNYEDILLAIGGISSTKIGRARENIIKSVPEKDRRPRTAIAYKDGYVYLITSSKYNYKMKYFVSKLNKQGFKNENIVLLDAGGSTNFYFHNDGNPIYKRTSRKVPVLIGCKRY